MNSSLHIKLPEPCREDWNRMTPTDEGRFCGACQHDLVDFTQMSDEELIRFFLNHRGKVCGRFSTTQLDRSITRPEKHLRLIPTRFARRVAAAAIFIQSLAHHAYAQIGRQKTEIVARNHQTNKKVSRIIKGIVQDYHNNKAVDSVVVSILGTNISNKVDKHGRFQLQLTDSMHGCVTIVAEYVPNVKPNPGTIILPVSVNTDTIGKEPISLYRYPDERLNKVQVVRYKPQLKIEKKYLIGTSEPVIVIKPTMMQRVKNFFRRKKDY